MNWSEVLLAKKLTVEKGKLEDQLKQLRGI